MKKKLLVLCLAAALGLSATACANSSEKETQNKVKEYSVDEFGKTLKETDELFQTESEYLTNDELYTTKGYELYEKCSKETGLPFNEKITIRGKKGASTQGFVLESADQEYYVPCFFEENTLNISLFVNDGENMVVSGIFSGQEDSYGCLTNVSIISPSNIDKSYVNNVADVLSTVNNVYGAQVVMGEVDLVQTLDDFENTMSLLNITNYESKDYYDTVVTLSGDEGSISFMYDKNKFGDLKPGDKIATQGYISELQSLKMADGSVNVLWGFMGNIYDMNILE